MNSKDINSSHHIKNSSSTLRSESHVESHAVGRHNSVGSIRSRSVKKIANATNDYECNQHHTNDDGNKYRNNGTTHKNSYNERNRNSGNDRSSHNNCRATTTTRTTKIRDPMKKREFYAAHKGNINRKVGSSKQLLQQNDDDRDYEQNQSLLKQQNRENLYSRSRRNMHNKHRQSKDRKTVEKQMYNSYNETKKHYDRKIKEQDSPATLDITEDDEAEDDFFLQLEEQVNGDDYVVDDDNEEEKKISLALKKANEFVIGLDEQQTGSFRNLITDMNNELNILSKAKELDEDFCEVEKEINQIIKEQSASFRKLHHNAYV